MKGAHRDRHFIRQFSAPLAVFIAVFAILGIITVTHSLASTPATASSTAASSTPPLYLGLDSYLNLGKLSYLEIGDRIEGQSTADPGGSNAVIHNSTLFDALGPGVTTFMRMQQTRGAPWTLGIDGTNYTAAASNVGVMSPTAKPAQYFPYPLSLNSSQSQGSSIIAGVLPFVNELKVTAGADNGNFYSIYRRLPVGSSVPNLNNAAKISQVEALLKSAGTDIAPTNIQSQQGTVTLGNAGTQTPIVTLTGQEQIRALKIQVPFNEMVQLGNSTLQIYWDGESTPSVSAPIKYIVGDAAGVYQPANRQLVQGLLANTTSDGKTYFSYNLYYPMPFNSSAQIVIVPNGASAGLTNVSWSARYQSFTDPTDWWAPFHANYVSYSSSDLQNLNDQDMTFLNYSGSGKLVGTVVNFGQVGSILESNPDIYVDGSNTPQIAGTGTEEWALGGDYWNNGQQVSLPLGGLPSATNNPSGTDVEGAGEYRELIDDSIPFNNNITVDWEHGLNNQATTPFSATMLWYGTLRRTAVQTDEFAVGTSGVAKAHNFAVAPKQQLASFSAAYEYLPYMPLISSPLSQTTGTSTFTMKLNPSNVGAFLRRTFDSCVANQRATVSVDGNNAGTWFDPGASPGTGYDGNPRCWRDEDFPLPASMTAGKSSITIKIQFVSTSSPSDTYWTASSYALYSLVM